MDQITSPSGLTQERFQEAPKTRRVLVRFGLYEHGMNVMEEDVCEQLCLVMERWRPRLQWVVS